MSVGKKAPLKKMKIIGRLGWVLVFVSLGMGGCIFLPTPPSTRVDRTASVYPEPRDRGCVVNLLTSPPTTPHKAFAQISVRGHESQMPEMEGKMKEEACDLGAHAVITFIDSSDIRIYQDSYPIWVDRERHTMVKDYPFSLIGIAIVYRSQDEVQKSSKDASSAIRKRSLLSPPQ
jgi:hypothetical protein